MTVLVPAALEDGHRRPEELASERATKDLPTDAIGRFFVARQTTKLLRMTGCAFTHGSSLIARLGPQSEPRGRSASICRAFARTAAAGIVFRHWLSPSQGEARWL
jgi:hypothetical protein